MDSPAFERTSIEQDIGTTQQSIDSLEGHVSRLRELMLRRAETPSESVWSDITAALGAFFEGLGERIAHADADFPGLADPTVAAESDSPDAFATAMLHLRQRLWGEGSPAGQPELQETQAVIDGVDAELDRLRGNLRSMEERLADSTGGASLSTEEHSRESRGEDGGRAEVIHPQQTVMDDPLVHLNVLNVDIAVASTDDDVVEPPLHVVRIEPTLPLVSTDVIVPVPTPPDPISPQSDPDEAAFDPGKPVELGELDGAVYDVGEILASGKTAADLRRYGVPAGALKAAGVGGAAALSGGYTPTELKEGEYGVNDLYGIVPASAMRDAGFQAAEMHGVYSAADCADAYSVQELAHAGFTIQELHGIVPLSDLRTAFGVHEVRSSFGPAELRDAGYSASELAAAGCDWPELASAGFGFQELAAAGAPEYALRDLFPAEARDSLRNDPSSPLDQSADNDS